MTAPRRIVIATAGSLGDLHPFIALARELRRRGLAPVVATLACYRRAVLDADLAFHPVRPHLAMDDPALMRSIASSPRGLDALVEEHLLPQLRQSADDLHAAACDAAAMIVGPLSYAAPSVAEARGLPWCWAILSPLFASKSRHPAPPAVRASWSPRLVLGLFSTRLAEAQPDWLTSMIVTGFPFYDGGGAWPPRLEAFLRDGDPPIVFTLGSAAVFDPRAFFDESVRAARLLGRRAVLLTGPNPAPAAADASALVLPYAPFSRLFPRAAAIVHQGGIGTVAQALRSGRPMLIVPRFLDQPDNAVRVRRLGVGRVLHPSAYTAVTAAAELDHLLTNPIYRVRAREVGAALRVEDGAAAAADALERDLVPPTVELGVPIARG